MLGLGVFGLQLGCLRGLGCCRFLLGLVQLGGGNEDRHSTKSVFRRLIAGRDEDLGIEVRITVARHFAELKGVFVAVVGDDMHVRRACLRPSA